MNIEEKNHKSDMKKLIIWSGGMDSTALVLKCIYENIPFDTIYFELKNNSTKTECEKFYRNQIRNFLQLNEKKYNDLNGASIEFNPVIHFSGKQYFFWLLCLFGSLNGSEFDKYDEIWFGYIVGDDFWHTKNEFLNIYTELNNIFQVKKIPVNFPLEWSTKEEIYNTFYKNDDIGKEVFKMITTCENPIMTKYEQLTFDFHYEIKVPLIYQEFKQCNYCLPCKNFQKLKNYIKENQQVICKEEIIQEKGESNEQIQISRI